MAILFTMDRLVMSLGMPIGDDKILAWLPRFGEERHPSDDPDTQVYSLLINDGAAILGSNGFPPGVRHDPERRIRPTKYQYITHAEQDCVNHAAALGRSTRGALLYATMHPCPTCAQSIITSEIQTVVAPKPDFDLPRWGDSFRASVDMLNESRVSLIHV